MLPFALPAASGYVVALSGGADSRLLLELTVRAVLARGDKVAACVRAAHMNHGIRGEEADRDEAFCRAECEKLGVPLTVERVDIPAMARADGQSVETAARAARYDFLVRMMKDAGFAALLTAHNADDQLETVLFHLIRGSGTRGMIGIPADRPLGETLSDGTPLMVFRPLLTWSRQAILEGIAELGLSYVTDSTNTDDTYIRNCLRHKVIPLLEEIAAPGIPQDGAVRLGQAAREDEDTLTAIAADRYAAAQTPEGLPVAAVAAEPPAIAKRMLRLAYAEYLGMALTPERTLTSYHLETVLALCREGKNGQVSHPLPIHTRAEIHGGKLIFAPCTPPVLQPKKALRPLPMGVTVWNEAFPRITVEVASSEAPLPAVDDAEVFATAFFPMALSATLTARGREPGDVILSHGMTKKLKKLICDKHIPMNLRDCLPLVCLDDGTPLWYPGVAYRDEYPAPQDGPATRITVRIHQSGPRE